MDILQEGIDIIDPRVSFTDIDQLNYAGLDLDKPEYVCFIPPKILSTLLMTSAGLKVADISCLYCAHQRGECPISALSYKGRRSLASEFHFKLNQEREQGEKWYSIPGFIDILAKRLDQTLLLPQDLQEYVFDYSEPFMIDINESRVDKDDMVEV